MSDLIDDPQFNDDLEYTATTGQALDIYDATIYLAGSDKSFHYSILPAGKHLQLPYLDATRFPDLNLKDFTSEHPTDMIIFMEELTDKKRNLKSLSSALPSIPIRDMLMDDAELNPRLEEFVFGTHRKICMFQISFEYERPREDDMPDARLLTGIVNSFYSIASEIVAGEGGTFV